jgi:hypothetical protein
MIGIEKRLLAMEDGRVLARRVVEALELAGAELQLDATLEGRVRIGVEVRIDEGRELAGEQATEPTEGGE